jgi:branched-chain amino acid transport system ATP-binding protein
MNTLSGLILDTKEKEDRKGGTRISIFGTIEFLGEKIDNMWPDDRVKKGIVLCRERHPVFVESHLEENLKICAYLRTRAEMKDAISFVYDIFPQLTKLKKRKAGLLSGGEQQMLAIGMALMANPRLMLLDEPLLGLSPLIQLALIEAIEKINRDMEVTITIAEQFARPLIPIIKRGYIVENGMLAFEGDGRELYENPDVRTAYFGVDYEGE